MPDSALGADGLLAAIPQCAALLSTVRIGAQVLDVRVQAANAAFCALVGLGEHEVRGAGLEVLMAKAGRDRALAVCRSVLENGNALQLPGVLYRRPGGQGEGVMLDVTLSRLGDGLVLVAHDVSERHRLQRSLERRSRELESRNHELLVSNEELESFAYSVSHDLRTQIRGIAGLAGVLQEDHGQRLDAGGRELVERIARDALKMGVLVDEMLRLARITRQDMDRRPVDLTRLAREAAQDATADEPRWAGRVLVQPGMVAFADVGMLRIALDNLLRNAVKFSTDADAARIVVGAREREGEHVFFVSDNGCGFDMAHRANLFRPFERLHGDEVPGNGIGLAIVHRVIERHDGRIWAHARQGHGATFSFTLPAQDDERSWEASS